VPIEELASSYPSDTEDAGADYTAPRRQTAGSNAEPAARETELQRRRKEMNRQKVEADAKPKTKSDK
jgi:uncharacterized protein YqfA (UPF0365 family)